MPIHVPNGGFFAAQEPDAVTREQVVDRLSGIGAQVANLPEADKAGGEYTKIKRSLNLGFCYVV